MLLMSPLGESNATPTIGLTGDRGPTPSPITPYEYLLQWVDPSQDWSGPIWTGRKSRFVEDLDVRHQEKSRFRPQSF